MKSVFFFLATGLLLSVLLELSAQCSDFHAVVGSSPAARRKKMDFKDYSIGEVGVELPPSTSMLNNAGRTTPEDATNRWRKVE